MFDLLPTVPYYTGHLAAALMRMKHVEVVLGSATYAHDEDFFQRMGVRNTPGFFDVASRVKSKGLRRVLKAAEYLLNLAALEARFLRNKPDVLHVQFTPLMERSLPFELWFLKVAQAFGIKLMYTVHNVLPHEGSQKLRSAYGQLYRIMDGLICHDYGTKERLVHEFGIERTRISVISHGPLFANERVSPQHETRPKKTQKSRPVVLWQGIIRPYKGVSLLLEAWKAAVNDGLDAELMIVGTGDEQIMGEIRQQIQSLGIESSVRLDLRFVSTEELTSYYESSDIVVYPYSEITTSGALMTGIGHGKAIIASDLPAFRTMLKHQKNALLVSHSDVGGWVNAIRLLASNGELRTKLASQLSADKANLPDWEAIARETVRAYESLQLPTEKN